MGRVIGRAEFFALHPEASAWAALEDAGVAQDRTTPYVVRLEPERHARERALVLGAGVAGLATAYELLAQRSGMEVTVLEALNRTGGRCLTLRTGDTLTEDRDSQLFGSEPGETQVVRFERPVGDAEPYLNAGPGRLPSSHKRVLSYLKLFGVDVEVYVMNSESNLVQMDEPLGPEPYVYRRIDHNVRGWLAQRVYANAGLLTREPRHAEQLRDLMVSFGELTAEGEYAPDAGEPGYENARSRAGFDVLPGVAAGKIAEPIPFERLLESGFWRQLRFYQPVDFLWQPTLFQPVGGMDMVEKSLAQQVAALGGTIHLNSPVASIDWDRSAREYVVRVRRLGARNFAEYRADYVFSNIAIPFLRKLLSRQLQGPEGRFAAGFREALRAVYRAQSRGKRSDRVPGYTERFLADTTKVGWQAERSLWQGTPLGTPTDPDDLGTLMPPESEVGVVPIYGGISWTSQDITQIWYPSTGYHDELGVLTGAYNFADIAAKWGTWPVGERLEAARDQARKFGKRFGDGLRHGVAVAWQNMPYIKGGWAQWHVVDDGVEHFNELTQGTGVGGRSGRRPTFFIVGDQVSSLPGWQEGAVASALNALSRLADPAHVVPRLAALPDTRVMVEGV